VPRITGVRAVRPGRVSVEVDGERWRTLPLDVVAEAGLAAGVELDRPLLRTVRRRLRRHRALEAATRALRARPRSQRQLDERLRRAGFVPRERSDAVEVLRRAGLVDDLRFALGRAEVLAERDGGDALIRHDLHEQGLDAEAVERAIASLDPESTRAARAAASRGGGIAAVRYLARRGFAQDAIDSAVTLVADEP
jgi:SOS response regulatory protein OraA/RecX